MSDDALDPVVVAAVDAAASGWAALSRPGDGLAFPLPGRFVAPGGFFEWCFYWDSCFSVLGLVSSGELDLAREVVDGLIVSVEEFGFVPNYNSPDGVCAARSQPPLLTTAIRELWSHIDDAGWRRRALDAATAEYEGYWTRPPHLTELGLSRYADETGVGCGTVPDTPHHRAMAESGWDNTVRFGADASQVVAVDLNAMLFRYEIDLAELWAELGEPVIEHRWLERAARRRELVEEWCWDSPSGWFVDVAIDRGRPLENVPRSLAAYVPLWAGLASDDQAAKMAEHLHLFESRHGIAATEACDADGTEHTWPTGWAYSHWFVCDGLRRYGYTIDAERIARKWLALVTEVHTDSGQFLERYNVVDRAGPTPGRYRPQPGFAWTNAVTVAMATRWFDTRLRPRR